MKRMVILACTILVTLSLGADPALKEVLHVYDEVNDNSKPYLGYFGEVYANQGIDHYQVTVAELEAVDLERYDTIVIHAMVMAFNMKSPTRDWLKTNPNIKNKKTVILITANRWFLDKLYTQQINLLKKNEAQIVDAISSATKELDDEQKHKLVEKFVDGVER